MAGALHQHHDLLDDLCQAVGCPYLSELRQPAWQTSIYRWLCHTQADEYPKKQWEDAFTYLLRQNYSSESTVMQLRQSLMDGICSTGYGL